MITVLAIALVVMTVFLFAAIVSGLYWRDDRDFWRERSLMREGRQE